jgi:hypothetical protein
MSHIVNIVRRACALQTGGCQDYYKLYQQCKLHIVQTGRQASIDDDIDQHKPIDPYENDQLLKEMLDLFGVLESVNKKQPKDMKKLARVLLTCLARMSNLRDVIAYESSVVNAMCKAEHQLPCVLHLHKRVIEKVMTMIYCVSLDEVLTTNKNARKRQIVKIAHIINTIAYGTRTDPGTYRVPYDPKTGLIGEVKFDESRAKDLEEELNAILPLLITQEPNKTAWSSCTSQISTIIKILSKKLDFTDDEIDDVERRLDDWAVDWIALSGREGMTNYTHLLVSGQVNYFVRRYTNMYRYLNQGWEFQNSQMKYIYMHRTNRGGSEGTSGGRSSKMKPWGGGFCGVFGGLPRSLGSGSAFLYMGGQLCNNKVVFYYYHVTIL